MVARYRKLSPRIWDDERFVQLSPNEKLLAVYCLTSQQVNRIGLFVFSIGKASEDLDLPSGDIRKMLDRVCDTLYWKWDCSSKVLFLPRWWRYNPASNAKHMAGCMSDAEELPQHPFWKEFRGLTDGFSEAVLRAFIKGMPYPIDRVSAQEQEQEQDIKPPKSPKGDEAKKKPKKRSKTATADNPLMDVEIPESLDTDRFRELWAMYVEHRVNLGKPLTPQAVQMQITKMAKYESIEVVIESMENSMASGWQGIHRSDADKPKDNPAEMKAKVPTPEDLEAWEKGELR